MWLIETSRRRRAIESEAVLQEEKILFKVQTSSRSPQPVERRMLALYA